MDPLPAEDDLFTQLPMAHAVGLRLHRHGATPQVIAVALGTDIAAVAGVIEVAERKLASLRATSATGTMTE